MATHKKQRNIIGTCILEEVLKSISTCEFSSISLCSMPVQIRHLLLEMPVIGIQRLKAISEKFTEFEQTETGINACLNWVMLEKTIKDIRGFHIKDSENVIKLLEKGASNSCLHNLFGIHKSVSALLRKQWDITPPRGKSISLHDYEKVSHALGKIENGTPIIDVLLRINNKTSVQISIIWNVILKSSVFEIKGKSLWSLT